LGPVLLLTSVPISVGALIALHMDGEKMSSTVFQIISVAAGLALLAADYMVVYSFSPKMKFLKGLVVTVLFGMTAAFLLAAARNFGP
jgi:hypothetical protein